MLGDVSLRLVPVLTVEDVKEMKRLQIVEITFCMLIVFSFTGAVSQD